MIDAALGTGLRIVGGVLGCARGLIERLGTPRKAAVGGADEPLAPDRSEATPREPAGVEGAKYYLGAGRDVRDRPTIDRELGELPRAYGRDRIVMLPRDPWWAFAYWEVTPTTRVQALRALGAEAEGAHEILRVYDVTFLTFTGDNAWLSFDVELPPGTGQSYLNVGRPSASFCAEIGLRTVGGRFLPLARSNVITTPRAAPSPDTTVRWANATHDAPPPWGGGRAPGANGVDLAPHTDTGDHADPDDGRPRSSDHFASPQR